MSQPQGRPPGPKILVVEDEPGVLNVTAQLLQRAGYEVASATSAEQALRMLEKDPGIGCAVVDLGVGSRGLEVVEWLRWARPRTHVIVVSVEAVPQLAAGVIFLPKPYPIQQLQDTIDAACPVDSTAPKNR